MALRVGFVGVGNIAKRHLNSCKKREDVEIVGHADVSLELAQNVAAEYGGNAYDDFNKLYSAEKPDALVICTPPFAHGDIEEAACEAKIPFFVEKPVAVNMQMANRVQKAVEKSGVATQVGYMFRFSKPVLHVREMLKTRRPAMVQAHYYMPGLPPRDWWRKIDLSGGQLTEQATHMIDLGRFLAGDVVSVSGRTSRTRSWDPPADYQPDGLLEYAEGFEIPDTSALTMEYAGGALGTLSCSLVPQAKWDMGFKVIAEGLLITIDGPNAIVVSKDGEERMDADDDWTDGVLFNFLDVVAAGGTETEVPYIEGVKSLAVSVAGYESVARGGAPVTIEELLD